MDLFRLAQRHRPAIAWLSRGSRRCQPRALKFKTTAFPRLEIQVRSGAGPAHGTSSWWPVAQEGRHLDEGACCQVEGINTAPNCRSRTSVGCQVRPGRGNCTWRNTNHAEKPTALTTSLSRQQRIRQVRKALHLLGRFSGRRTGLAALAPVRWRSGRGDGCGIPVARRQASHCAGPLGSCGLGAQLVHSDPAICCLSAGVSHWATWMPGAADYMA